MVRVELLLEIEMEIKRANAVIQSYQFLKRRLLIYSHLPAPQKVLRIHLPSQRSSVPGINSDEAHDTEDPFRKSKRRTAKLVVRAMSLRPVCLPGGCLKYMLCIVHRFLCSLCSNLAALCIFAVHIYFREHKK